MKQIIRDQIVIFTGFLIFNGIFLLIGLKDNNYTYPLVISLVITLFAYPIFETLAIKRIQDLTTERLQDNV